MINISIFGWYGTETLGDRAILDGIFQILNSLNKPIQINIGSLYPNFTKRTFLEDEKIYQNNSKNLSFKIFDVYNRKLTNQMINNSQMIIMGGGPIMDLEELTIINKAFLKAKKLKKKTMLFGCGMGPLYKEKYKNIVKNILKNTDLCIFRDKKSIEIAKNIYSCNNYYSSSDPAILSIIKYLTSNGNNSCNEGYACANFRVISQEYNEKNNYDDDFVDIIKKMADMYPKVLLVPMHTYAIGGDDRLFLTQLANKAAKKNVLVMHKPLNLYELYDVYYHAKACIGMRYHSVVMQTILNGNNIIIDYTDKKNGKIISFLNENFSSEIIKERYINIKKINHSIIDSLKQDSKAKKFSYNLNEYSKIMQFYKEKIEELLYEKK